MLLLRKTCFRKGWNSLGRLKLDSFNFMDQIKKVADLGEIFRWSSELNAPLANLLGHYLSDFFFTLYLFHGRNLQSLSICPLSLTPSPTRRLLSDESHTSSRSLWRCDPRRTCGPPPWTCWDSPRPSSCAGRSRWDPPSPSHHPSSASQFPDDFPRWRAPDSHSSRLHLSRPGPRLFPSSHPAASSRLFPSLLRPGPELAATPGPGNITHNLVFIILLQHFARLAFELVFSRPLRSGGNGDKQREFVTWHCEYCELLSLSWNKSGNI